MINKALKFYYPSLVRINLNSFAHLRPSMEDSQSILTEKRIKQCRYSSDIFYSLSNEKTITPHLLHQYCYKLSSIFIREKPKTNIVRVLELIRKADRSQLTLEELSNYAAICSACIDINLIDYKLFRQILGEIRAHLKNKEEVQALPLYALINLYQYCTKNQFPTAVSDFVEGILRYFNEDRFSINDFCIATKILSERTYLVGKEKAFLMKLLKKIRELYEEDYLNIGPKIRLYASIRRMSFFQPHYTYHAKFLKEMIDFLEKDLMNKIEDMNQSNILLLLRELPSYNPLYKMIISQILENIDESGHSEISPQLLSKLLRVYSSRITFKKMNKFNFDKIFKMYQKNLSDIHYSYPRDILQLLQNKFFSKSQFEEIQKLFEENGKLQGDIEYVYECLESNIIFQDYSKYDEALETLIPNLQDKNFAVIALSLKRLCVQFPENQKYAQLYKQYLEQIEGNLPNELEIIKRWKSLGSSILENFIEQFGDLFIEKMYENILQSKRPWFYENQLILLLFLGNSSRFLTSNKVSITATKHVLSHVLNTPEIAYNKVYLLNRIILQCLRSLEDQSEKEEKKKKQPEESKQKKLRPNGKPFKEFDYNIGETLFFIKVLAYISNKQINSYLKAYDADQFIQIAIVLLQKFPKITEQNRANEMMLGLLVHSREFVRETKSYQDFLTQLTKHPEIISFRTQAQFYVNFVKRASVLNPNFANYCLTKMDSNDTDLKLYLDVISGNITSLTNVPLVTNNLSILTYLGSYYPQINELFLSTNLTTVFQLIDDVKYPQFISEIFGHIDRSRRVKINTAMYDILMKLIERLTSMAQNNKAKNLNLVHPIRIVMQNLKEYPWVNNKGIGKFLLAYTEWATTFFNEIPLQVHLLTLQACVQNRLKNQKYFDKLVDYCEHEPYRSYSYLLMKLRIFNEISAQREITLKNFDISRMSNQFLIKHDRIIFNLLKNMMIRNNSEELMAQIKKFLKLVNTNLEISSTESLFMSKKSNGELDASLSEIKQSVGMHKNPKYLKIKEVIVKLAEKYQLPCNILNEASQQVIKIENSYIYISQQGSPLTFLNEIEYISTLFKDKFVHENDNLFILCIKKSNSKHIMAALQKACPVLIKDIEQARQIYFELSKNSQEQIPEEQDQQEE